MKKKMVFMYKMQVGGDKYNSKCKVRLRPLRSNCYSCSYIPLHALFFKFLSLAHREKENGLYIPCSYIRLATVCCLEITA